MSDTRTCTRCGATKPIEEFPVVRDARRNPPVKIRSRCRGCTRADKRAAYHAYKADPERYDYLWGPTGQRRRKYGLTRESFDALVLESEGRCALCEEPTPDLVIDHDHSTGAVRGLICGTCNTGLGLLGDSADRLMRAVAYLLSASQATLHDAAL